MRRCDARRLDAARPSVTLSHMDTAPNVRPWRFSVRTLLGLTTLVAVAYVAIVNANERWLLLITSVSYLIFMSAVVAAVIHRGSAQAFAIGFLLFGVMHWAALRWDSEFPTPRLLEKVYYRTGKASLEVGRTSPAGMTAITNSVGLLKQGDTGAPVLALQAALNEQESINWKLTVDGHFGARTGLAVAQFQMSQGQTADGIVTLKTWRALGPAATRALKRNRVAGFLTATPAEQCIQIGCWLVTLVVAYLGGHVGAAVYVRRWKNSATQSHLADNQV